MKKFDLIMGINVRASFALSQAVLPQMIAQKYGHIIMMSPPSTPRPAPTTGPMRSPSSA